MVRESLSPYVVLTLMTPKKNSSWWMHVNSKLINKIVIKYQLSIPYMDDMLDVLVSASTL